MPSHLDNPHALLRSHVGKRPRRELPTRPDLLAAAPLPLALDARAVLRVFWLLSVAMVLLAFTSRRAAAQASISTQTTWLISANSEGENYLRALQLVGMIPPFAWSLRAFSPDELLTLAPVDTLHAWRARFAPAPSRSRWTLFAPEVGVVYNSGFPYGSNDGAVWAGRGLTASVSMGGRGQFGPLSVEIAPTLFRANNDEFALAANGESGRTAFANARYPRVIDLPQRFGNGPYQRLDPGQSSARVTARAITGGVSTANEFWGPAVNDPFLLGNEGPGFYHLFLGTAHPVSFAGTRLQVRALAGRLQQSDYSTTDMTGKGRYISALVGVMTFAGVPGFEVGAGRIFHNLFPDSSVSLGRIFRPLVQNLLKDRLSGVTGTSDGDAPDNQLASIFARAVFPASGVELYGEMGREDNAYDLRDLLDEPDHDASFLLGFQKAWNRAGGAIVELRVEGFNDRLSHLQAVRQQSPAYLHTPITQGHTNLGQVLGAPDGVGGAGTLVALDKYTASGRTSLKYTRGARQQTLFVERATGLPPADVVHGLTLERLTFGPHVDFTRSITYAYELNRDYGSDAVNWRLALGARAHW